MYLSFDEWNIWYQKKQKEHPWQQAPEILEDQYSLLDAITFGGLAITLLNNSDRVKIACLAQLVNTIAPIFTEKGGRIIKQSIYYPFRDISKFGRGTVLKPIVIAPAIETSYGDATMLPTSVVYNEEAGELNVFCVNISEEEDLLLNMDLRSFGDLEMVEHIILNGDDLHAVNTFDQPDIVKPSNLPVKDGKVDSLEMVIPKVSWNVIRFKTK
jgi:alpha-N-arabinofuranosidase